MTDDEFKSLCARREGGQLDFKERFYDNSDAGNAELAKDIMAIANALASGAAGHILFGVREATDGTGEISGCTVAPWITDSNLQQKVRGYLNRLPPFSLHALQIDGVDVLAIQVKPGGRPFYPLRDKGVLRRHIALVRVGSSTDLASPDEILAWARQDEVLDIRALEADRLRAELAVAVSVRKAGTGMVDGDYCVDCAVKNLGEKPIRITDTGATWRYSDQLVQAAGTWPLSIPPDCPRDCRTFARIEGAQPGDDAYIRVLLRPSAEEAEFLASRQHLTRDISPFHVEVSARCENLAGTARDIRASLVY